MAELSACEGTELRAGEWDDLDECKVAELGDNLYGLEADLEANLDECEVVELRACEGTELRACEGTELDVCEGTE